MIPRSAERATTALRGFPFILLLLVPSWITYLTVERQADTGEGRFLFYSIPDLIHDPLSIPPALLLTPLVNTETDQILLVTVLIATFGVAVERRLGITRSLGLFWGTSTAAALGAGVLLHALHPFLSDVHAIDEAWNRLFNGGSAGAIGLMGAFAATARWPLLWIGIFLAWELTFWAVQLRNFTAIFHLIAFPVGYLLVRHFFLPTDSANTIAPLEEKDE